MSTDYPQGGYGNWNVFDRPLEEIYRAADEWRAVTGPIARPWLIWHVSDRWTQLQQRLVQTVGWTPVLGQDPRATRPTVLPGSVYVDFNARFRFPVMWMHFALEFAYLWVGDRLAFWHSDLLCRQETMRRLAAVFEGLRQGQMSAVFSIGGRRNLIRPWRFRYWELAGCTTKEASRQQFQTGAGWWKNISDHPNCRTGLEKRLRKFLYWDHGAGIFYWKHRYHGQVVDIPEAWLSEGHCTSIGKPNYKLKHGNRRNKELPTELDENYNIEDVAANLGISSLISQLRESAPGRREPLSTF